MAGLHEGSRQPGGAETQPLQPARFGGVEAVSFTADHAGFWRLAQALFEVMPRDAQDWKMVGALLGERATLRTEIKRREAALIGTSQSSLFREPEE